MHRIARVLIALALLAPFAHAAEWPQFRGPGARGVLESESLPITWSATENVLWQADIPGRGWSSPVVWGDQVFLTSVVNQGVSEEPRKGLYFGGDRKDAPDSIHQWKIYAIDLKTGTLNWERQVHEGKPASPIHIKNSYASETPTTDGERLYVYFGGVGLFCFDLAGNPVWEKPMPPRKMAYGWGTAASPVLHGDRLYHVNDNEEASTLTAYDKRTGAEVWSVPREEGSNWSTPFIWENGRRTEIITPGSDAVRSYDLDGKLLWSLTGMSSITIATPFAGESLLYISSGYVGDKEHRPIYAIRPGASGDITLAEGQTSNEFIAWSHNLAAPYNPSTLLYRDRLYVLYDRGQFSAYDANTGAPIYEKQDLPKGAGFTASPWAGNGHIFCLNEDGVTHVLRAGDTFEVVASNALTDNDMGMATPALTPERLLLRTATRLYAIGAK